MPLLFFEFLGTTELLVILLVALVVFGPRKLPELGRSLGRSISEFKRASDDLKRTWESEVDIEKVKSELHSNLCVLTEEIPAVEFSKGENFNAATEPLVEGASVAA